MKLSVKEFLLKCQFPLLLVAATAPVALFLFAFLAPEQMLLCWVTPGVVTALVILSFLIPGKFRLFYGIITAILLAASGLLPLLAVQNFFLLLVPILYCILYLWCLPMASWSSDEKLPAFCYWGGLLFHIISKLLQVLVSTLNPVSFDIISGPQLVCFFAFAGLAMLSLTQSTLASAANGRRAPASMKRKNVILTVIFFVVALLFSFMPAIINAINRFIDWLLELLGDALSGISATGDVSPVGSMQPTIDGELGVGASDPGLLSKIFNVLFIILGIILIVVVAFYAAKFLIRLMRKLIRHFLSGLADYAANISEDYIDEITDTRTTTPKQKKVRISAADERAMTPAQRIRYRYQRLLYKHPNWDQGSTARENLPSEAAAVYEQARYSSHPVTQEDATQFANKTKRI